jgi:hypothetical protein
VRVRVVNHKRDTTAMVIDADADAGKGEKSMEKKPPACAHRIGDTILAQHLFCFVLLITRTFFLLPFFIPFTKKYLILVLGGYGICCLVH